jgi:hypothetical protein
VTSDDYIIVGVLEPGDPYTPTDKSTRALLIFGMDGKQQHTYQYDSFYVWSLISIETTIHFKYAFNTD